MSRLIRRLSQIIVPATLVAPLSGSLAARDRGGVLSLVGAGALRWQPAPGARINYAVNGAFDSSGAGWWFSNITTSYVSSPVTEGTSALQAVVNTAGSLQWVYMPGPAPFPPGQYTVAVDVYNPGASDQQVIIGHQASPAPYLSAPQVVPAGTWRRLVHTFNLPSPDAYGYLNVLRDPLSNGSWQVGTTFILDAAVLTPGTDGTYFAPAAWLNLATGQLGSPNQVHGVEAAVAWIEESTTNEIPDPIFGNTDITLHWSATGNATVTRDAAPGSWPVRYLYSPATAKIQTSGAAPGEGMTLLESKAPAVSAGQVRTAQVALRRSSGSGDLKLQIVGLDSANAQTEMFETQFTPLPSGGAVFYPNLPRVTATFTNPNTVKYVVRVVTATASAQTFYVGYLGLEPKPYATSPCHGGMGTGYSWSGTANASASSRSATTITIPNAGHLDSTMNDGFSLSFWFARLWTPASAFNAWAANSGANEAAGPARGALADGRVSLAPRGDGSGEMTTSSPVPVGELHHYAATWDGTTWRVYFDGAFIGQSTGFTPSLGLDANSVIRHGLWGPVTFFNRPLTSAEIQAIYNFGTRIPDFSFIRRIQ